MGLVTAIFCFIKGIPIFLGGLGLVGWGAQQYMKATPADMDQWTQDARQLYHDRCIEYYGPNGTVYRANPYLFDDDILFNEAKSHIYTEDVDRVYNQAVSAGATSMMPVMDMFWGDRYGQLKDPFGHIWSIATHKQDLSQYL